MSTPRQQKLYRLEKARGIQHRVPTQPAAEHIQKLIGAGAHPQAIGDASGVAETVIAALARGEYKHDHLRRTTADAILAVTIHRIYARPLRTGGVPPRGTLRRIQALLALGWSHRHIQDAMGDGRVRTQDVLSGGWRVTRATHEAVHTAYEHLSGHPGPSKITRTKALRSGYAPPLAWDDIDTDPEPTGVRTGDDTTSADLDEWLDLVNAGEDCGRAARRLGVTITAIARSARRHGRLDIAQRAETARHHTRRAAA